VITPADPEEMTKRSQSRFEAVHGVNCLKTIEELSHSGLISRYKRPLESLQHSNGIVQEGGKSASFMNPPFKLRS
jgi:hypothetical protein